MKLNRVPLLVAAALSFADSSVALERRSVAVNLDALAQERSAWASGGSCNIHYYNLCTSWTWVWSGFEDGDRIGVVFDVCVESIDNYLYSTTHFTGTGSPVGYGFTGTISVHAVDANDCPVGAAIESQPFFPSNPGPGFTVAQWKVYVPSRFAVVITVAAPTLPNPASYGSDHPAAGPTGPQACGTCYPADRSVRSNYYGSAVSPLCPGAPLDDGICASQLLWDAFVSTGGPFSVDAASWGAIKALYR